jgi:hypothetical protein
VFCKLEKWPNKQALGAYIYILTFKNIIEWFFMKSRLPAYYTFNIGKTDKIIKESGKTNILELLITNTKQDY